jgi:hypothetical protein
MPVPPIETPRHRWLAPLLLAVAVALVPWTIALSTRLPTRHVSRHWDAAWVGFDIAEAAALAATAVAVWRGRVWLVSAAAFAAAFLLTDAWFDNLLANGGGEHLEAALEAAFGEVPLALICVWLTLNAEQAIATALAARGRLPRPRRRR